MVIDVTDPAGWVANRDICQAYVEPSMGGLDDGEGIGRDIFERIIAVVHWVERGRGRIRGLGKRGESERDMIEEYFKDQRVNDLIFDLIPEEFEVFDTGGTLYKENFLSDICLPNFSDRFTASVSYEKYRIHSSMMAGF